MGKASLELQKSTADLVLHGRPALVVMVVMVVVVDLGAANRGALDGDSTTTAEEAAATGGGGGCRPGNNGARAMTMAVGKGHDGQGV